MELCVTARQHRKAMLCRKRWINWLSWASRHRDTNRSHSADVRWKKQLGLTLISKYLSEWLLTNCNALLCYILLYIFCFSAVVVLKGSPRKQWNYYGQKMIWNLRQGVRIQRDMEFHHSHPGSFTCPEYSSDTRDRPCAYPSDGRVREHNEIITVKRRQEI